MKDVFGEALDYNANDYTGAGFNEGTLTTSAPYGDKFSGTLKAVRWHSHVDNHVPRAYTFTYDNLNQMDNADWGTITGTLGGGYGISIPGDQSYKEDIGSYDKNGNIQSLVRKGKNGTSLANYTYNYTTNTNKLSQVTTGGNNLAYLYNTIGQMTQQTEGANTMKMKYNAYGLVKEVRNASDKLIQAYKYDDRGNKVVKTLYDPNAANNPEIKSTYYVHDASGNVLATYEKLSGQSAVLLEVPIYGAGRVAVYKPVVSTIFYEVSDHLGNVRGVIGQSTTMTVTATMETSAQSTEQNQFLRYNNVRVVNASIFDHTNGAASGNSIRLSGSVNEKTGLARSFSVSAGDVVKLSVYAKYVDNDRTNVTTALNNLVNAIAAGTAPPGTVIDGSGYNGQNPFPYAGLLSPTSSTGPKAFLNYLFFDKDFVFDISKSGFVPVTDAAKENGSDGPHEKISAQLNITEEGYVYAYLSNDNPTPIEVYFDDFSVTHDQSSVVAGGDYYPFGLPMPNRETTDEPYRYGYQGQFSEKDLANGMQEFELRNYDPRIGRWLNPDPYGEFSSPYLAMGNDPTSTVDPDGGTTGPVINPIKAFKYGELPILLANGMSSLPEVVVSASRISLNALPTVATVVGRNKAGGEVFVGTDDGLYSAVPTNSGTRYYQAIDERWQLVHDEGVMRERYANQLYEVNRFLFDLDATIVSFGVGGGGSASTKFAGNRPVLETAKRGPQLLLETTRMRLLRTVENTQLRKVIDYLYREGAKFGNGSTGSMIREELKNGTKTSASGSHIQKAKGALNSLRKLLKSGNLSEADRKIVFEIIEDLTTGTGLVW